VALKNGEHVAMQFRPEPLYMNLFRVARKTLGEVVPNIEQLQDEDMASNSIWVYCMSLIAGQMWWEAKRESPEARVTFNRSLAKIIYRGCIEGSADQVVETQIKTHLNILPASVDPSIQQFHEEVKTC
jgi:hypothetical protein